MIDYDKLLKELNEERVKYYGAWKMYREYWDKGYSDGIDFARGKIMERLSLMSHGDNK